MSDSSYSHFRKFYQSRTLHTEPSQPIPSFPLKQTQNLPFPQTPKPTTAQPFLRNFYNRTQLCNCQKPPDLNSTFHLYSSTKEQRLKTETGVKNTDRMNVLIEENENLKEQNKYLQKQVNKGRGVEEDLRETTMEYENIMSVLNSQNIKLHKQILYLTRNATDKVDELKTTVNKIFKKAQQEKERQKEKERERQKEKERMRNKKYQREERREEQETFQNDDSLMEEEEDETIIYRQKKNLKLELESRESRDESEGRSRMFSHGQSNGYTLGLESKHSEMVIDGSCPFEEMLDECRREPDPKKRKWMRKKLAEYTYKRASS